MNKAETKLKRERAGMVSKWAVDNIWSDVVYMCFTDPIKYDYTIPSKGDFSDMMKTVIGELQTSQILPKSLKEHLVDICSSSRDYYSRLAEYTERDWMFGNEFFYGFGTLYRFRSEQTEKAALRIKKYMPKDQRPFITIIQDVVKKHIKKNMKTWQHREDDE